MTFPEYDQHDATGLAALVRQGQVSPTELLDAAIERVDGLDPTLNAVVHRFDDLARDLIARGLPDGPFTGVPFLLKGTGAALAGAPLTNGTALMHGVVSPADSTLAVRYKAAGLVPFGRTSVPEFALSFTTEPAASGPTRNPWDLARSPGGSSGGSAAAVASRMVPMAHAADGGGSIRVPAAHCGVFGFKPTRMRNPMGPDLAENAAGMATPHAITISVRDSARLLDASSGPDIGDPYAAPPPTVPFADHASRPPGRLRIALVTAAPAGETFDAACLDAAHDAARLCEELGHIVEPATIEFDAAALRRAWRRISGVGLVDQVAAHGRRLGLDPLTLMEPVNAEWAEEGRRCTAAEYLAAVTQLHRTARALGRFFTRYDVLLSPVTASPATPLGTLSGADRSLDEFCARFFDHAPLTPVFNAAGCPAMSLPLAWTAGDLPIGIQFGAAFGNDGTLFALAAQLEQARPWAARRPMLPPAPPPPVAPPPARPAAPA